MSTNIIKKQRFLSWTAIIYPESCAKNWQEILDEMAIAWAVSPLHDKDLNPTGEAKKPHYHLALAFRSVKSYEQVKEITEKLKATVPQPVNDVKAMIQYFVHLNNPEKYQYQRKDILSGGGFDVDDCFLPNASQEKALLRQVMNFLREQGITEYCDLCDYIDEENKDDWFFVVRKNSFHIVNYLRSVRCKALASKQ